MVAFADGTEVHKQEVWTVLKAWGHTRKKRAIVPGRARPHERLAHRGVFLSLYIRGREDMVRTFGRSARLMAAQWVFVDEKTVKGIEVKKDIGNFGYAAEGHRVPIRCVCSLPHLDAHAHPRRLPFQPYVQYMPNYTGVIGALGVVAPAPMLDGDIGDLGLFTFSVKDAECLTTADIVEFFEHTLSPLLGPFPGPRSIVVLDNAPGHRALENFAQQRIIVSVQRRGALLIWNPPHSPDWNPIEHIWHVNNKLMNRMIIDLACGRNGNLPRPFTPADLPVCLRAARLSRKAIRVLPNLPI